MRQIKLAVPTSAGHFDNFIQRATLYSRVSEREREGGVSEGERNTEYVFDIYVEALSIFEYLS